ncbi:hypothetical protein E2C01_099727 [Portunus trituberculatus]|uniref:Uncharacterized protein n=1 Tax=Portunus trituberculatus TaxID=210409 RepID=A0A5B7KFM4_PORTR|nr:hypothetical protein [Portunus trituberculatus]
MTFRRITTSVRQTRKGRLSSSQCTINTRTKTAIWRHRGTDVSLERLHTMASSLSIAEPVSPPGEWTGERGRHLNEETRTFMALPRVKTRAAFRTPLLSLGCLCGPMDTFMPSQTC